MGGPTHGLRGSALLPAPAQFRRQTRTRCRETVPGVRVRSWAIGLLAVAAAAGVAGATWDAAWHVTLRRESFWSPPHLLLYTGTALALAAGVAGLAPTILPRGLTGFHVATIGALVVIGSAPLDDFWHRTFGPDVDVWSLPHLVALAGGAAINMGSIVATRAHLQRAPRWLRGALQVIFLTALLWLAIFSLNWYTLVLARVRDSFQYPALASLIAAPVLVLAARVLGRGGATLVSALAMAYTVAAFSALSGLGYALLPFPPMLIAPAVAIDVLFSSPARRRWAWGAVAGLGFAPLFVLAEWASLTWYPHAALPPPRTELALGYFTAAVERPWEPASILVGLPLSMAAGAVGGLFGWWLASRAVRSAF